MKTRGIDLGLRGEDGYAPLYIYRMKLCQAPRREGAEVLRWNNHVLKVNGWLGWKTEQDEDTDRNKAACQAQSDMRLRGIPGRSICLAIIAHKPWRDPANALWPRANGFHTDSPITEDCGLCPSLHLGKHHVRPTCPAPPTSLVPQPAWFIASLWRRQTSGEAYQEQIAISLHKK